MNASLLLGDKSSVPVFGMSSESKKARGKCIDCPKITKSKCSICSKLCCPLHVDRANCLKCDMEPENSPAQAEVIRRTCRDGSNLRTKCSECPYQTRSVCPKCSRPWCKNRHTRVMCSECQQTHRNLD